MNILSVGLTSSIVHAIGLMIRMGFILGLVHLTSTDLVGLYALAVSIENVVVYIAGMEFHTFTSRRFAKTGAIGKLRILVSSHCRQLFVAVPVAAVSAILIAKVFSLTDDLTTLILLALLLVTSILGQELGRYLVITRRPTQSVVMSFLRTAAWQPVALLFINSDSSESLFLILCCWLVTSVTAVLWAGYLLRGLWLPLAPYRYRHIIQGVKLSRFSYVVATVSIIHGNLERFVLQLLLGPSALGVYSFFQTIANTLGALVQAGMLNIALPNILDRFGRKKNDRFEYLKKLRKQVLSICFVVGVLICLISLPLIIFLSKPDYMSKIWLLPLLVTVQTLMMWTQPIHLALFAAHQDRILMGLMVSALVTSLILDFVFVEWMHLHGAVMAPILVWGLIAIFRIRILIFLNKHDRI